MADDGVPLFRAKADHALIGAGGTQNMTLTDILAIVAAIISLAALFLNWRTRHDVRLEKRPIVAIAAAKSGAAPNGWHRYTVTIRSRANMGYAIGRVRVLWPRNVLIASRRDGERYEADGSGGYNAVVFVPQDTGRSCSIELQVAKQGSEGHRQPWGGIKMGTREEDHEDFFLSISSSSSLTSFRSLHAWFSTSSHWRKAWLSLQVTDEQAATSERRVAITLMPIRTPGAESRS